MPPERLSSRGATEFGAELSLPLRTEIRGRENSAEFGREFTLSLKDVTLFYNKHLVWLCWQSEANLSLPAIWGNAG